MGSGDDAPTTSPSIAPGLSTALPARGPLITGTDESPLRIVTDDQPWSRPTRMRRNGVIAKLVAEGGFEPPTKGL